MTIDNPVHLLLYEHGQPIHDELISNETAFAEMLDSFASSAAAPVGSPERNAYLGSAEEGLSNQCVLDAAYQSWHEGRRIDPARAA